MFFICVDLALILICIETPQMKKIAYLEKEKKKLEHYKGSVENDLNDGTAMAYKCISLYALQGVRWGPLIQLAIKKDYNRPYFI